jgi:hypothetical protein
MNGVQISNLISCVGIENKGLSKIKISRKKSTAAFVPVIAEQHNVHG